ncbi:MAG: apolipoprotein N-acyltransferase [Ilumatobacteraceae bacterium]|nr:apolipoprotein N-acyltransferase [Ilumatobacteraceae bacterium]
MNRLARPALALLGGWLVALSLPPWGWWPLGFVGVILLETSLGERPTVGQRAAIGFAFGLAWMAMGMGWMWQLTIPGYIAATLVFAGFHAAAAAAAPGGPWRAIGRPAAHALVEAVRLSFPFGGVPLATMGIAQSGGPLLGVARVVGVIGITWIVFQVGVSLAGPSPYVPAMVRRRRPGARGDWHGVLGLAVVALIVVAAVVAPDGEATGRSLTVAAVQGGGEQGTRAIDVPSEIVTERHLEATRTIEPAPELDMVLWPENVIDVDDEPFEGSEDARLVAAEAARLGVPLVVGITEDAEQTGRGEPGQITNAQVVVTPDGAVTSRYDKVRRVPFGEYVPLRGLLETLGAPVDQVPTNAVPGTGPAVIELPDGTPIAVAISWEIFFAGRVREGVKAGGELIANPTNGASYTGTIVQTQQVASSRLRAVETGRDLVQVSPTGFSAFVDHDGTVVERTAVSEQRVITAEVELRTGRTWYTSLGDGPLIAVLVVALAAAWWFAAGRQRWASRLEQHGDGPVVDELDPHVGAEPAGRHHGSA